MKRPMEMHDFHGPLFLAGMYVLCPKIKASVFKESQRHTEGDIDKILESTLARLEGGRGLPLR